MAIRYKIPKSKTEDPARELAQHAYFVKHCAYEKNRGSMGGNLTSLKIDLDNVKETVGRLREDLNKNGGYSRVRLKLDVVLPAYEIHRNGFVSVEDHISDARRASLELAGARQS